MRSRCCLFTSTCGVGSLAKTFPKRLRLSVAILHRLDRVRLPFTTTQKKMYGIGRYSFQAHPQSEFVQTYNQEKKHRYPTGERNLVYKKMHWLLKTMTEVTQDKISEKLSQEFYPRELKELLFLAWSQKTDAPAEYKKNTERFGNTKSQDEVNLFNEIMTTSASRANTPLVGASQESENATPSTLRDLLQPRPITTSKKMYSMNGVSFLADDTSRFARTYQEENNKLFAEMYWVLRALIWLFEGQGEPSLQSIPQTHLITLLSLEWYERTAAAAEYNEKQALYTRDISDQTMFEFKKIMETEALKVYPPSGYSITVVDSPPITVVDSPPSASASAPSTRATRRNQSTNGLVDVAQLVAEVMGSMLQATFG